MFGEQMVIQKEYSAEILKTKSKALNFENSELSKKDLDNVLKIIKKKKSVNISKESFGYNKKNLKEIIKRLKMLGKVFDPYLCTKKEGEIIRYL